MCTIALAKVQRNYNCYNVYFNECLPSNPGDQTEGTQQKGEEEKTTNQKENKQEEIMVLLACFFIPDVSAYKPPFADATYRQHGATRHAPG